uniref:Haloacid dehalogenase-like hydrolase domain-containing protein 3 n=1 Tax=Plectus sambesii TaxID=2011161 RepID=A0A914W7P4_9BILA
MAGSVLRAVSFDAMNTLIKLREPVGVTYASVAGKMGVTADADKLTSAFKDNFATMAKEFPCYGHDQVNWPGSRSLYWWTALVKRSFVQSGVVCEETVLDDVARRLVHHYATRKPWKLVDEQAPALLRRLRRKGLHIVVMSNFDKRLRDILSDFDVLSLVDAVVLSGDLGFEKPDSRIFEVVMRELKLSDPTELVHIGDSYEKDYSAARKMGMRALLLDPDGVCEHEDVPPEDRVKRLGDLRLY